MGVPAYLPSVFPSVTAAAEESDPVGENVIDLSKLVDYLNDDSALPAGVSVKQPENFDDIIEVTITQGGTYTLKGSNYIGGAYLDVKFIIDSVDVTFNCEDVFIKNDKLATVVAKAYEVPEGSYSPNRVWSFYTIYNHVAPFEVRGYGSGLTLRGKLYIDTSFAVYPEGHIAAPYKYGNVSVPGDMIEVDFYELNNGAKKELDKNYFIRYIADSAEDNSYNIGDYIDVSPYECIRVNGSPKSTFGGSIPKIYLGEEHNVGEDGKCTQCHDTFTMRTVTIKDGSETLGTLPVVDGKTIDPPAAPTAPAHIGKKFDCWVDENGDNFDFSVPIKADVTIYAKYSDSSIKSAAAATAPTKIAYKEADKFDLTGLKIKVTYDDDRFEEIEYNESTKDKFTFSPALDAELSPNDTKITVTYGEKAENGSNTLDIPINVAEKQVTGIAIKTEPTKTAYIEGENFDPTGLVITASYDNGTSEDIVYSENSAITFAPDELSPGDTKVIITYGSKSADQEITVAKKQLTGIAVKTEPTKTNYVEGDKFDPTGLVLTVTYNNGKTEDITYNADDFTITPSGALTVSDTSVTVGYGGKTAEIKVTVTEAVDDDHTHSYDTNWSYDETSHWHECECGEKSDVSEHISDGGKVTVKPTETTEGEKTYSCSVCGYVMKTETLPVFVKEEAIKSFVERLYENVLGRSSDESKTSHIDNLTNGETATKVAYDFVFSPEFTELDISNEERVTIMYNTFLNRDPDPAGLATWTKALDNGCSIGHIFYGFTQSGEFGEICDEYGIEQGSWEYVENRDKSAELTSFVSRLYTKALGRKFDVDGLNDHTGSYLENHDLYQMAYDFIFSQEFTNKNLSDEEFVDTMYRTFFDREGDPDGRADWIGKLKSGMSREDVLAGFVGSQECADLVAKFGI